MMLTNINIFIIPVEVNEVNNKLVLQFLEKSNLGD